MRVSEKQREMLAFIEGYVEQHGFPPTHEEIRVGLNISTKSLVNYHLEALQEAALLSRSPNTPRGIRLRHDAQTVRVPLMNNLQVASKSAYPKNTQEFIELTYDIVPQAQNLYALRVQGDAMLDALVNDGDVVVIQRQVQVKNGDLAAIQLLPQNQTILKRYFCENGRVRLQPVNPKLKPLIVKPEAVRVDGKVMAIIRQVS
ncbi:MAG: transcriptional repressor LexA [Anaerolineae bacterium]